LTVLAYDEETCRKVIKALCAQFLEVEDDESNEFGLSNLQSTCNDHVIFKNENQSLRETVSQYLRANADGTWQQPKRKVRTNDEILATITPRVHTQQAPVFTTTPASAHETSSNIDGGQVMLDNHDLYGDLPDRVSKLRQEWDVFLNSDNYPYTEEKI
jgi:hypothetical protein